MVRKSSMRDGFPQGRRPRSQQQTQFCNTRHNALSSSIDKMAATMGLSMNGAVDCKFVPIQVRGRSWMSNCPSWSIVWLALSMKWTGFGGDCFGKELQMSTNWLVVHEAIMMNDMLSHLPLRVLTTMALPLSLHNTPSTVVPLSLTYSQHFSVALAALGTYFDAQCDKGNTIGFRASNGVKALRHRGESHCRDHSVPPWFRRVIGFRRFNFQAAWIYHNHIQWCIWSSIHVCLQICILSVTHPFRFIIVLLIGDVIALS